MRFIYISSFLIVFYVYSPAQGKSRISAADSLHFCGYFKEELVLRKISSKATVDQQFLLDNAQVNILLQNDEIDKAKILWDGILAKLNKIKLPQGMEFYRHYTQARLLRAQEKWTDAVAYLNKLPGVASPQNMFEAMLLLELAQNQEYVDGVESYKKAIKTFERLGYGSHYCTALAYNNLAFALSEINLPNQALKYTEKAAAIWAKNYQNDIAKLAIAYNNIIYNFINYGDNAKCTKYQNIFEQVMRRHLDKVAKGVYKPIKKHDSENALIMYHLSSIRYYGYIYVPSKMSYHLQQLEQVFKKIPLDLYNKELYVLNAAYNEVSYYYRKNGDFVNALKYNKIAEGMGRSDFEKMKAQAMYALINYDAKNYEKALVYAQRSLDAMAYTGKGTSYMTVSVLKAELLARLKQSSKAINTLRQTYQLMVKKNIDFNKLNISYFADVSSTYYINIFIHSGLVYRSIYEQNGKKQGDLAIMKQFYKLAADMFGKYYQKGLYNPELDQYYKSIKEGLLFADVYLPKNTDEQVASLNRIENLGSQHLIQQMMLKNQENLNLPLHLIEKKNELQIQKTSLELLEKPNANQKLQLEQTQNKIAQLDKEILQQNPQYQLFVNKDFDLKTLQNKLLTHQSLVKYSIADSSVFAHHITKQSVSVHKLGSVLSIENLCKQYHKSLSTIDFGYNKTSVLLYSLLVKPWYTGQKDLNIVAEGFLSYIPFETLIDNTGKMLCANTEISYHNSLKIWSSTQAHNGQYRFTLTGFSPKYTSSAWASRAVNGQLIYTANELEQIGQIMKNSSIFKNEDATKNNFLKSIGQSQIHHLAMHSALDTTDYASSKLLFQNNESMSFNELYALNFPSELVVLSACNTGVGKYSSGEGLMSLSRALNYAGVNSLIHSLWPVPDKETSQLMSLFYEFLEKGKPKNEALVMAKQQFMENNPAKNHPYYWAGFVLNGHNDPISNNRNKNLIGWLFLISLTVTVVYLIMYKRNKVH